MVSLLFGLPLLTAYYNVDSGFYFRVLLPYLLVSLVLTVAILLRPAPVGDPDLDAAGGRTSDFLEVLNRIPVIFVMCLITSTVVTFGLLRYLVYSSYPYPPPAVASDIGSVYLFLLLLAAIFGVSRVVYWAFPVLKIVLGARKLAVMSVVLALGFFLVYLLLVNQVLIQGFNVSENVATPTNSYPYAFTFTVGIEQPILNMIYLPYAVVQLSPEVSLLIIPFEVVFAVALSVLVSANVVMSYFLISKSGLRCSTPGTAVSALGSVVGLTATCPTCLVPTLVSVIFGGITAAEEVYSNVYGAVLPPVLSLVTLLASLIYLNRTIRSRGLVDRARRAPMDAKKV
jgi:hypothetical protein